MRRVILWTQEDCPLCEGVRNAFAGAAEVEERPASALLSGERPDREAMTQLAMQDFALPLVQVDGEWADPAGILAAAGTAA
jgi:hypothetical protein